MTTDQPAEASQRPRTSLGLTSFAAAAAVLALVLSVIGLVIDRGSGGVKSAPSVATKLGEPQTFDIELGDLFVKPNALTVEPNRPVILKVHNGSAAMEHDLKLNGTDGTKLLKPGESQEVNLGPVTNGAQAWCTVAGHKDAGMLMTFTVAGGAAASGGTTSHGDGATPTTAAGGSSDNAKFDASAKPSPDWKAFDPTLKPADGATTHDVTMNMTEKVLEVAPGVTQEMWTFDDMVPGPVLRGKIGDVFNVTVVNKGKMPHSIDFHASEVAPNRLMKTLKPGESEVYQFKANYSGIWMYHCATAPALHHIGNGMYGAVIVDPPNLAPVDKEFVFVQSEFYFGPQGQPGDLAKMKKDQWDVVVFNGYANQYVHAPIKAEVGKRYRAWVIDDGPSENSSFHIVGTIFDTVFKEGNYLLKKGNENGGGSQALDLQPAQGGFVEWQFAEDGRYTMVTHKFSNVARGAAGFWDVGNFKPAADGGGH